MLEAPDGDVNRYLFSTKEFDARSGLYYFGARYYDPETGRWLTPDPAGFVDGLNLYAYVNNNPVNMIDPDGAQLMPMQQVFGGPLIMPITTIGPVITTVALPQGSVLLTKNSGAETKTEASESSDDDEEITTFWQYFTKGWKNFKSPWFVKGKGLKPPYKLGKEARRALNLPKKNKATAVQPYYPEKLVGPRTPKAKSKWGWPNEGIGKEYFDGDAFPD